MLKNKDKITFSGTVDKNNPIKLVDENDSNNARIEVYSQKKTYLEVYLKGTTDGN